MIIGRRTKWPGSRLIVGREAFFLTAPDAGMKNGLSQHQINLASAGAFLNLSQVAQLRGRVSASADDQAAENRGVMFAAI